MLRLDKMQTTDKDTHQYIHVQFRLITLSKPFCFFFVCSFLHFITVTNKTSIGVKGNTSIKIMTKENESQKKKNSQGFGQMFRQVWLFHHKILILV